MKYLDFKRIKIGTIVSLLFIEANLLYKKMLFQDYLSSQTDDSKRISIDKSLYFNDVEFIDLSSSKLLAIQTTNHFESTNTPSSAASLLTNIQGQDAFEDVINLLNHNVVVIIPIDTIKTNEELISNGSSATPVKMTEQINENYLMDIECKTRNDILFGDDVCYFDYFNSRTSNSICILCGTDSLSNDDILSVILSSPQTMIIGDSISGQDSLNLSSDNELKTITLDNSFNAPNEIYSISISSNDFSTTQSIAIMQDSTNIELLYKRLATLNDLKTSHLSALNTSTLADLKYTY